VAGGASLRLKAGAGSQRSGAGSQRMAGGAGHLKAIQHVAASPGWLKRSANNNGVACQ